MHWDMFLVSLRKPTADQEVQVCNKGQRLGFNYKFVGSTEHAPPLPEAIRQDKWWVEDHQRVKVGYGKQTFEDTKRLVSSWGHFQLPWAQVRQDTAIKPGNPVCVTARVFGIWTAVPLQVLYRKEGNWQREAADRKMRGKHLSFANGCLKSHYLAGEERFAVVWDRTDDSVWYDIYSFSRPDHPLAVLGYPVVRLLQWQFRQESLRSVARAVSMATVNKSLGPATIGGMEK
eukprot:jgi/Chrzof1/7401/Cz02g21410.t1